MLEMTQKFSPKSHSRDFFHIYEHKINLYLKNIQKYIQFSDFMSTPLLQAMAMNNN